MMGAAWTVMAMLTKTWVARMAATPAARQMPNSSAARSAVRQQQRMKPMKATMRVAAPKKPVSSAMTEKMKSVGATVLGRYNDRHG